MKSLLIGFAALLGMSVVASPAEAKPQKTKIFIVEPAPNQAPLEAKGQHQHKNKGKKGEHHGEHHGKLQQAVKDGRITKQEAKQLKAQKRQLHQMKQAAAADGVITRKEHRQINKAKESLKQDMNRAMNNQKTR